MKDFIEQQIVTAVRELLTGRVNEILRDEEFDVPYIEFGNYQGGTVVSPAVTLTLCEKSEKERIVRIDAYSLTITFTLPEKIETVTQCYAYTFAVYLALKDNPTLGGVVDRVVVIDTPGMREIGLWDSSEGISLAFAEVEELFSQCRFNNCTHETEPGCAVLAALQDGSLSQEQWKSYLAQRRETSFVLSHSAYLKQKQEFHKAIARNSRARKKRDGYFGE